MVTQCFNSSLNANTCRSSGEARAKGLKFGRRHGLTAVSHVGTNPKSCDRMVVPDAGVSAMQLEEKETSPPGEG